jgi:transposase
MAMLAEVVDVVVGVDTHKHTHTAAVVSASTGGVLDEATVGTEPDAFEALVAMAGRHGGLRVRAVEGSGSYGAGLTRFLRERGEWVVELDRPSPTRPPQRGQVRLARRCAGRARGVGP